MIVGKERERYNKEENRKEILIRDGRKKERKKERKKSFCKRAKIKEI